MVIFQREYAKPNSLRPYIVYKHSFNNTNMYIIQRKTVNYIEKSYKTKKVKTQWIGLMK